jgi:prevent-host-death family protein
VHFGKVLREVEEHGETIVVERAGVPKAVIKSVTEYQRLQGPNRQPRWLALIDEVRAQIESDAAGRPLTHAADVIEAMRAERDAELTDLR